MEEDVIGGRGSLVADDGERRNFHRSVRAPPATRGHAGHITRRYDTAGHSLTSRLCRVPGRRAEEAFSIADPDEDRPWTWFLNRDRFDTFRVATCLKVGKFDEAQQVAADLLARLSPAEGKRAAVIRESIASAHLARGSVTEAAQVAQNGLAIVRETEFTTWMPKFEDLARGLLRLQRQPHVRAYLEDFAMTKRQFAQSPR
jgi:hypothetical protein